MIAIAAIHARRDQLAQQFADVQALRADLKATLKETDRQLCAMAGGLQELDRLLAEDAAQTIASNGAREDAIGPI